MTLLHTADHLRNALAAVVEPYGITLQQYNVLRILRGAGKAGLPTLEIAQRMIERNPGITRLLERLEAKDLVRRRRGPEDRRQVVCQATPAALALLAALDDPIGATGDRLLAPLAGPRTTELVRSLDTLRARARPRTEDDVCSQSEKE